ncbi:MAG: agmatinase [Bacteroidetes bacterium RBG_19FT_COMBO_42_10]|nr:MAG: agmatinase [Bacteroidetes bacterium RBG_19FT_COMBO_42_10]
MNFGGAEVVYDYSSSRIIVVPVPYDETSTWVRGSDMGPDAIMEASVNLEFYDVETGTEVHKKGIHTIDPVDEKRSPETLVDAVHSRIWDLLQENKFPVIAGGNHTVSIGSVKAFAEHYKDLSVLQLDAHSDLRQEYEGSRFNHACTMARILELAPAVQVGIRSVSAEELPFIDKERIYYAYELYYNKKLYLEAADKLTGNVYVTIDLDVFDPAIMPSTGTPEPGGPDYFELMHFLRDVAKKKNIVGFDVVELCPSPANKMPDFIAAKIIYQLLSYIFCPPTGSEGGL